MNNTPQSLFIVLFTVCFIVYFVSNKSPPQAILLLFYTEIQKRRFRLALGPMATKNAKATQKLSFCVAFEKLTLESLDKSTKICYIFLKAYAKT